VNSTGAQTRQTDATERITMPPVIKCSDERRCLQLSDDDEVVSGLIDFDEVDNARM